MQRSHFLQQIKQCFRANPVVALLGARQSGKTTLAKQYVKQEKSPAHYFDLENPEHLRRLQNAHLELSELSGLIVIDEVQRLPDLFPILRVLVDEKKKRKFLILGSASRDLIRQSLETLAGRISYIECSPFHLGEVNNTKKLLLRGGFPKSFMAKTDDLSVQWRDDYISTFLERDIPNLGFRVPPPTMRRFWLMLTHYHGQIFNASELGKALGIAHTTVRHYLEILTGTFMVRELAPWLENIGKRQVKSPKIYFRDSGIYQALLGIKDEAGMKNHPKLGTIWEGFALEQVIAHLQVNQEKCFFWGVHGQSELDLLVFHNGKRIGFECKYHQAPTLTQSMHNALDTLRLDRLYVVYPGKTNYRLADKVEVLSGYNLHTI